MSPRRVEPTLEESLEDDHAYLFAGEPLAEASSWSRAAACRDADPESFFPIGPSDQRSKQAALAFCRRCVVRAECLTHALSDRSLHGIWGGLDEAERERLRRSPASVRALVGAGLAVHRPRTSS